MASIVAEEMMNSVVFSKFKGIILGIMVMKQRIARKNHREVL